MLNAGRKNGLVSQMTEEETGIAGGIGQKQLRKIKRMRTEEKKLRKKTKDRKEKVLIDSSDMVNHPSHYASSGIECIDAMESMTSQDRNYQLQLNGHQHYCWQVVFKYLWRFPFKNNGIEDLKKARWYLNRLIDGLENSVDQ